VPPCPPVSYAYGYPVVISPTPISLQLSFQSRLLTANILIFTPISARDLVLSVFDSGMDVCLSVCLSISRNRKIATTFSSLDRIRRFFLGGMMLGHFGVRPQNVGFRFLI